MSDAAATAETYILCEVAGAIYGIPSRLVQHIEMVEQVTPVPNAPAALAGVVFSRGQVVPVLSLRVRFGFAPRAYDLRTRLVVIASAGRTVGLLVDSAREFASLPSEAIKPPPATIGNLSGNYLAGVATLDQRLVLLLHVDEVLNVADALEPKRVGDEGETTRGFLLTQ